MTGTVYSGEPLEEKAIKAICHIKFGSVHPRLHRIYFSIAREKNTFRFREVPTQFYVHARWKEEEKPEVARPAGPGSFFFETTYEGLLERLLNGEVSYATKSGWPQDPAY